VVLENRYSRSGRWQYAGNASAHGAGRNKETSRHWRIAEIKNAAQVPLTLHGTSGTDDGDLSKAITAGINIIHIDTELRFAWRRGLESGLANLPDEVFLTRS